MPEPPAVSALDAAGVRYRVIRHGPVAGLAQAARARGVEADDVVRALDAALADVTEPEAAQ